jgi:hypothetical protein
MPTPTDASAQPTEALVQGGDSTIPRMRLGQSSYNGLYTVAGTIQEECSQELRWPQCMQTYKKMAKDATIAPALNLVEMAIARVPWSVEIPEGYEDELAGVAEHIRQCMNDMEHSWGSFIRQASSFNRYGFAPVEKVYRKRYKRNGSKYDDGLVGIASLPLIAQDTVASWDWEDRGRKLSGLYQYVIEPSGKNAIQSTSWKEEFIPRKKFMLIRNSPQKDNPEGESPLKSCWLAWKYKTALEDFEGSGIASDMRGFRVLRLNPRYLDPEATPEDKLVLAYYENFMRNAHVGEQTGIILPSLKDEQGKELIADLELLSVSGQKAHDINAVIGRYRNEIISSLMASQLILGQGGGGSFSLAESLQSISNMAIESKLIELQDALNHDLIPQLCSLNGWSTAVTPMLKFGDLVSPDLDVLSSFIQRTGAAGLLRKTPATVAWIANQANMPIDFPLDIDQEEFEKNLTAYDSKAGEGMKEGLGAGVGMANGAGDKSASNKEN